MPLVLYQYMAILCADVSLSHPPPIDTTSVFQYACLRWQFGEPDKLDKALKTPLD